MTTRFLNMTTVRRRGDDSLKHAPSGAHGPGAAPAALGPAGRGPGSAVACDGSAPGQASQLRQPLPSALQRCAWPAMPCSGDVAPFTGMDSQRCPTRGVTLHDGPACCRLSMEHAEESPRLQSPLRLLGGGPGIHRLMLAQRCSRVVQAGPRQTSTSGLASCLCHVSEGLGLHFLSVLHRNTCVLPQATMQH